MLLFIVADIRALKNEGYQLFLTSTDKQFLCLISTKYIIYSYNNIIYIQSFVLELCTVKLLSFCELNGKNV